MRTLKELIKQALDSEPTLIEYQFKIITKAILGSGDHDMVVVQSKNKSKAITERFTKDFIQSVDPKWLAKEIFKTLMSL